MKKLTQSIMVIMVVIIITSCNTQTKEIITDADFAITGVNVISMLTDSVNSNQTVIIKGQKIIKIAKTATIKVGANVENINGKGKFLIPGLTEMHAHIPIPKNGDTEYLHETMMLFVANGITTIRGMKGDIYHLTLKSQTESGKVVGPRIFTCGARLNSETVKNVEGAHQIVKEQFDAGFDFVKIHRNLSPELFHAIADAADELGIRIAGHIPESVGLGEALSRNYTTVDHFDGYMEALVPDSIKVVPFENGSVFAVPLSLKADLSKVDELVALTKKKDTWVVPTQAWLERLVRKVDPDTYLDEPEMAYVSKKTRDSWINWKRNHDEQVSEEMAEKYIEIHRLLLKKIHDAGVGTLFGGDAPQFANVPGFYFHHEVKAYQAAGLSNYDILKMATVNPATFFEKENTFGSVREGLDADLVLLDENPIENMENLKNPAGVMLRGKWFPQELLIKELDKIAAKYQ